MLLKIKRTLKVLAICAGLFLNILFFQNCSRLETLNGINSATLKSDFASSLKGDGFLTYCSSDKKAVLDDLTISVAGSQEKVWASPASNDVEGPIPDGIVSAYRDAQGKVSLVIPHVNSYRLTGDSLDSINPASTEKIFSSAKNVSEAEYDYSHWLFAPYSQDGVNFVGINHHEWYACLTNSDCNNNQQTIYASWFNSLTKTVSNNGGNSWTVASDHLIMAPPRWNKQPYLGKPQNNRGIFHPSRVVKEGSFYYLIAYVSTSPDDIPASQGYGGMMTLRTADFKNWQVWTGGANYAAVGSAKPALIGGVDTVVVSLTYNSSLCAYMMVYTSGMIGRGAQGVKYRLSSSMVNPQWTAEKEIVGTSQVRLAESLSGQGFIVNNYPSLIDPYSSGYNFEISGSNPYLYYSTFGQNAFVRSIYRLQLKIEGTGVIPSIPPDPRVEPEPPVTSTPTPAPVVTPTPAPQPGSSAPALIPTGLFAVGSSIYHSNGTNYCYFSSWESFVRLTGKTSVAGIATYSAVPTKMPNDGACQGSVGGTSATPISGFFIVSGSIYYSNGSHYCYYPSWSMFTTRTGRSNTDGIPVLSSLPSNLVGDGTCQ